MEPEGSVNPFWIGLMQDDGEECHGYRRQPCRVWLGDISRGITRFVNGTPIIFEMTHPAMVTHAGVFDQKEGGNLIRKAPIAFARAVDSGVKPEFCIGALMVYMVDAGDLS